MIVDARFVIMPAGQRILQVEKQNPDGTSYWITPRTVNYVDLPRHEWEELEAVRGIPNEKGAKK